MRSRLWVPAAFLTLTLFGATAGCGDDALVQGTASPPTSDPSDSVSSPPQPVGTVPGAGTGQASPIRSRTDLVGARAFEPESVTVDPSNNQRLLVRFWGGVEPCFGVEVRAVESATDVTVTVLGGAPPDVASKTCIALAKLYEASIDLKSPIGSRSIVVGK
jgi:hypothetical protein